MTARYAIYYCPEADAPLTHAAATFLGRDAFHRPVDPRAPLPGLDNLDLDHLTADPRGYGFHATLKAPFELADGRCEEELVQALEAFCRVTASFTAPIEVSDIGPFIALRLAAPCIEMDQLHRSCVTEFESFRAPLSTADLERRRRARLTVQQDLWLQQFGYPYIFDDFRFHMTLTGAIKDDGLRAKVVRALSDRFASFEGEFRFETLALFKQEARQDPFNVVKISRFTI